MVKKITNGFEQLGSNTAISEMIVFMNDTYKEDVIPKE